MKKKVKEYLISIMDELSDEEFEQYCIERKGNCIYDVKEMVNAYYHGDLDLHNFFRKLGKKTIQKLLEEI
jgi:hypothetical protein